MLFFGVLAMFIVCSQALYAQCASDFSYEFTPSEGPSNSGKIELFLNGAAPGAFTINLYKMEGKIVPVEKKESSAQKIVFERLAPAKYFIKIEWGNGCRRVLGGLEGIMITAKDQER